MKTKVSVIDYGLGNLFSVSRAFEFCGADVSFIKTPAEISDADYLILPGVGAFKEGMENLGKQDLIHPIQNFCNTGKPFMGICLGMQMMLQSSEEFGQTEGLSIVEGQVKKIPQTNAKNKKIKVPHVGWTELSVSEQHLKDPIVLDTSSHKFAYFVHSFAAEAKKENILFESKYHDLTFCSALIKDQCYGFQFHPEKSGKFGLSLISNFLKL